MSIPALQDAFRAIEESPEGRTQPTTSIIEASGNEPFSEDGTVTNALTITILPPYEMGFQAGAIPFQSSVGNLLGVFVDSPGAIVQINNAVGSLNQNSPAIEYASFNGYVTVDTVRGAAGQQYPIGTPSNPVNNLADALAIGNTRGFKEMLFASDYTFLATDVLDDFIVRGRSFTKTYIVLTPAATITNCKFLDCDVEGQLDGGNELVSCRVENLNYIDGALIDCELEQTVTINGIQADFIRCYSGVAGGGVGQTPTIDMNGGGHDLVIRDYQGGIRLINDTMGADNVSIDMSSGRVVLDSTITAGVYTLRGIGTLEDNSSGTAVVDDQLLDPIYLRARLTNIDDVVKHIEQYVFVDTELLVNGDGSARSPYNNVTDAKDYAEANEIFQIITYSEITIDRTLKNFNIIGIGQPVVDMNGQSVDKCRFSYCTLRGQYTGSIVAQNSVLDDTFYLNGFFENCGVNGTLTCLDGGNVLLKNCASIIAGLNRPTISMNGTGSSNLAIRDWQGGLTITDCNNALDAVTVEIMGGSLTFDATCTAGTMVARGLGKFVDNSNGATVTDETAFTELATSGATPAEIWTYTSRTLTEAAGVTPQDISDIVDAVWDEDLTLHNLTDSAATELRGALNVNNYGDIANAVWTNGTRDLTAFIGLRSQDLTDVANAVWDEPIAGNVGIGSFGEKVNDIALSTDNNAIATAVWTYIGKSLDTSVNVSTASQNAITAAVWAESTRTLTSTLALTSGDIANIVDSVWDEPLSGHLIAGSAADAIDSIPADVWANPTREITTVIAIDNEDIQQIGDEIWDRLASGHTSAGTMGKLLADAAVYGGPSASDVATEVWGSTVRTLTNEVTLSTVDINTIASEVWLEPTRTLTSTLAPTTSAIATAVWDNAIRTLSASSDPTASQIATAVWADASRTLTGDVTVSTPSIAAISTDVWSETVRSLTTDVTIGAGTQSAIAANVWTNGTRTLTGTADISVTSVADIQTAVWNAGVRDLTTDATLSAATIASISTDVWSETSRTLTDTGLTSLETQMLTELWQFQGLDLANPVTQTQTTTTFGSVTINYSGNSETAVTAQRA